MGSGFGMLAFASLVGDSLGAAETLGQGAGAGLHGTTERGKRGGLHQPVLGWRQGSAFGNFRRLGGGQFSGGNRREAVGVLVRETGLGKPQRRQTEKPTAQQPWSG